MQYRVSIGQFMVFRLCGSGLMPSRIVRKHNGDQGKVLAEVVDSKTKKTFQVARIGQEDIGLVFADEEIIKIPIWYFFMVARGLRDAENRLLKD
jgi:hypothetical protein